MADTTQTQLTTLASDFTAAQPIHQASNLPHPPLVVDAAQVPLSGGTDPAYGDVQWRTLINSCAQTSRDMVLGIAEFGPHGRLLPHRHDPSEFYLGLDGDGTVTIDGVAHQIAAGVAIYVPAGAEHGVEAGTNGLRFAYGFAESSFEQIEYRFSAES